MVTLLGSKRLKGTAYYYIYRLTNPFFEVKQKANKNVTKILKCIIAQTKYTVLKSCVRFLSLFWKKDLKFNCEWIDILETAAMWLLQWFWSTQCLETFTGGFWRRSEQKLIKAGLFLVQKFCKFRNIERAFNEMTVSRNNHCKKKLNNWASCATIRNEGVIWYRSRATKDLGFKALNH